MKKKNTFLVLILILASIYFVTSLESVKAENNITIGWSDFGEVNQVSMYTPQQGFVFKIVNVSITNNGYDSISTNPIFFTATSTKSGSGFNCDASATLSSNDWVISDLDKGWFMYGALVFQMPVDAKEISHLSYNNTSTAQNYNIVYTSFIPYTSNSTPTPTVPEFSFLVLAPLFVSVFAFAMVLRHCKTLTVKWMEKGQTVKFLTVQIKASPSQFSTPLYLPPGQKKSGVSGHNNDERGFCWAIFVANRVGVYVSTGSMRMICF